MVQANEHGQLSLPKTINTGLYFTGTNEYPPHLIIWKREMHCLAGATMLGTYVLS